MGLQGYLKRKCYFTQKVSTNIGTRLADQRRKVKQHIAAVFPETLVVEAEALLIGDRSGMDEEEASTYRRLGITHLFAISGLHVGLLALHVSGVAIEVGLEEGNRGHALNRPLADLRGPCRWGTFGMACCFSNGSCVC